MLIKVTEYQSNRCTVHELWVVTWAQFHRAALYGQNWLQQSTMMLSRIMLPAKSIMSNVRSVTGILPLLRRKIFMQCFLLNELYEIGSRTMDDSQHVYLNIWNFPWEDGNLYCTLKHLCRYQTKHNWVHIDKNMFWKTTLQLRSQCGNHTLFKATKANVVMLFKGRCRGCVFCWAPLHHLHIILVSPSVPVRDGYWNQSILNVRDQCCSC